MGGITFERPHPCSPTPASPAAAAALPSLSISRRVSLCMVVSFLDAVSLSACSCAKHQCNTISSLLRICLRHNHGYQRCVLVSKMAHVSVIDVASYEPPHRAARNDI